MCSTCGGFGKIEKSERTKAEELAKIQATAENKLYVVIEDNGIFYPECYECRQKDKEQRGKIVTYVG